MELLAPQPLIEQHSTTGFDCGDDRLNLWLQQRALASGAVAVAASSGRFRRNMPDPIPVVVLARLAVCRSVQGQGIARALLADAFERVLMASKQIGVRGLVVHAASASARDFYLHMGFDPSPTDPNTLLLRLVDIAATLKA